MMGAAMPMLPTPTALAAKRCWLLDADGVLHQDRRALPGAERLIRLLRRHGRHLAILTNSSAKTRAGVGAQLKALGFDLPPEEIITSAAAAVHAAMPIRTAMVLGGEGIVEALQSAGVGLVEPQPSAVAAGIDAVFVGMDRRLTYARLTAAVLAIQQGARFIATNADSGFPGARGLEPGAGALVAAVAAVVGRGPELVAGKPGPALFHQALAAVGLAPAEAIMVGDQLETDILGGARVGIETLLVRTGLASHRTDREILRFREHHQAPTYLADDLTPVVDSLEQGLRSPT
jgi:4-nitrophenyl phosphatase